MTLCTTAVDIASPPPDQADPDKPKRGILEMRFYAVSSGAWFMNGKITYFSCPTCGAPLTPQIRETGQERCLYCDVISVYTGEKVSLDSGDPPTTGARVVGKVKRYGTLLVAPLVGWSAITLLNAGRIFSCTEEPFEFSAIVAGSVVSLMILGRWLVAGIWTLFFSLALVFDRALASRMVAPEAFFSWTSEVTMMPIGIAAGFLAFFAFLYASLKEKRLQHEQQKFRWRTSVAILFLVGLAGGIRHYSQPMSEEVIRAWAWSYGVEMQQLTELETELDRTADLPDSVSVKEELVWGKYEPDESCNVVFLTRAAIELLPESGEFFTSEKEQHLWIKGRYMENLSQMAETVDNRSRFTPLVAPESWKTQIDIYAARWMVIFDHDQERKKLRVWLVKRTYIRWDQDVGERRMSPRLVAYRETPWDGYREDTRDVEEEQEWVFSAVRAMTGDRFQVLNSMP